MGTSDRRPLASHSRCAQQQRCPAWRRGPIHSPAGVLVPRSRAGRCTVPAALWMARTGQLALGRPHGAGAGDGIGMRPVAAPARRRSLAAPTCPLRTSQARQPLRSVWRGGHDGTHPDGGSASRHRAAHRPPALPPRAGRQTDPTNFLRRAMPPMHACMRPPPTGSPTHLPTHPHACSHMHAATPRTHVTSVNGRSQAPACAQWATTAPHPPACLA